MSSRPARALGLLVAAALGLAGCNDDGRTLEPTSATMPPSEVPATTPAADPTGLRVTSPDVVEGGALDPAFTCDGAGLAPLLVLSGAPPAAAELAVAIVDLDAADFVHLVVAGLPSTTDQVDLNQLPEGAVLGRTDTEVLGWDPPCPPPGDAPHRYEIRIYAAAEPIGLAPGLPGHEAISLIEAAAIDVARLGFTYAAAG
jgi:phosphatidylethanolamine-binding protein (PEBP) family uncharacterized protein